MANPFGREQESPPEQESPTEQESPPEQEDYQTPWVPEPLDYNLAEWYYDMGGDKIMLIFNHYEYKRTIHFNNKRPKARKGTARDVLALQGTFPRLGFQVEPEHQDKTYEEICNILRELCERDHRNTSCVCVCVLTHGDRGGVLYAADQPYEMKDLLNILQFEASGLVGKPKLLIVQACRGGLMDPGQEMQLELPSSYSLFTRSSLLDMRMTRSRRHLRRSTPISPREARSSGSSSTATDTRGPNTSNSRITGATAVLPSHVDILVLKSSVEDYVSFRDARGSWLIQELCRVVKATHHELDVPQMVALVTSLVARERRSNTPLNLLTHEKKQTPEMWSTLTKLLRLTPL